LIKFFRGVWRGPGSNQLDFGGFYYAQNRKPNVSTTLAHLLPLLPTM